MPNSFRAALQLCLPPVHLLPRFDHTPGKPVVIALAERANGIPPFARFSYSNVPGDHYVADSFTGSTSVSGSSPRCVSATAFATGSELTK